MKNKLFFLLLIIFYSSALFSQNAYYDALKLKEYLNINNKLPLPIVDDCLTCATQEDSLSCQVFSNYIEILKIYFPEIKNKDPKEFVSVIIDTTSVYYNPFLSSFLQNTTAVSDNINLFSSDVKFDKIASNISGLDVTNIADGLARFIVERTKEELTSAFFQKFKDEMLDPKYNDLKILFPQTYNILLFIDSDIYMFNTYLSTIREAFQQDLSNLFLNLEKVVNNEKYKEYFNANKDLHAIILSSLFIIDNLSKNKHPGDILNDYTKKQYFEDLDTNISGSIKTLNLFSQSLKSKSEENFWISPEAFKLLIDKDSVTFNIYLGLLYQKADDISFVNNKDLKSIFREIYNNEGSLILYKDFILTFNQDLVTINNYITEINDKKKNKIQLTYNDYYKYFDATINLFETINKLKELPYIKINNVQEYDKYLFVARNTGDLYLNINNQNYSSAIINTVNILDTIFSGNFNIETKKITKEDNEKTRELIFKYGTFISNIASAESSLEVKNIIEATALPSGSSRIKRETPFNVSLNAYCGLFTGTEHIKGADDWQWNSFGVAAPVGIAVSAGQVFNSFKADGFKRHSSHSLFLSIVDIGALASFRFTNDSTENVPNVELKDILSPGVFYSWGIPKSSLSLNIGYQLGPILRKVNMDAGEYSENYTRVSVSFVVDIPILNLYTKPKK